MARAIPLDQLEPLGDAPLINCVVAYPWLDAVGVVLVSFDRDGHVCERLPVLSGRVDEHMVAEMVARLM